MTNLPPRGRDDAASILVPSLALLALSLALLAAALFPSAGLAADEEDGPTPPELSFPQATLDFGKATTGTETATVTVTVHNAGSTAAAIDKVMVEGPDSGDFKLSGSNCGWLEPGQDCSAWIAFAPGSVGSKTATLAVQPKEFPAQTMPLSGAGVEAQFAFTPGSHDFGVQRTNESQSTYFQLTNTGEAFAYVGSTGIAGRDTGNFWTSGGDCWNGRRLDPGESCGQQVTFNAWDAVSYEAQLQAFVAGSTFTAELEGTGGRALLEAAANPVEFGAATAGGAGAVKTIVLTNNGNIGGAFFIAVVAGGDSGSFQLLDESCTGEPVAPGGTCIAHVRFAPTGVGTKVARLALFGDGDGGTMVMLSGAGVAPTATLVPAAFDFGLQAAGSRSASHDFVVRNDGPTPLDLGTVAIVGVDLDQFSLAGDECTGESLAPGAECAVRVRFAPDGAGAKGAKLRIGAAGAAFVSSLAGTGTPAPAGADRGPDAANANPGPPPRPWRRARNPRFVRGESLTAGKLARPHRVKVRPNSIPR